MLVPFTKMQALGNDFVIFDFTRSAVPLSAAQAARIADRHFGVGCDQILIVENSDRPDIDFKYRILNADGSEVGQCGNGARCFARFVHEQGLTTNNPVRVETITGEMSLMLEDQSDQVTVEMGVPQFEPGSIPLAVPEQLSSYTLGINGSEVVFSALSIGNPHAVIVVQDIATAPVYELGPMMESHAIFPQRANIGFMQVISRNEIALRVYERGAGETLACGSGACAAAVSGISAGLLDERVTVRLPGGELSVYWAGTDTPVMMTGPATTSFTGQLEL